MKEYYIFNLKKEFAKLYKDRPSELFYIFNRIYYMKEVDKNYGYNLFEQICNFIDKKEINEYLYKECPLLLKTYLIPLSSRPTFIFSTTFTSTISKAKFIALSKAFASLAPCALTTGFTNPIIKAPPTPAGSNFVLKSVISS